MPSRTTRRKTIAGLALGAAAALAATASLAGAQVGAYAPDGGPSDPPPANVKVTTCGAALNSIVRTQSAPSTTSSKTFGLLPGASTNVTVPMAQTRCLKVLFTAETACGPSLNTDYCYIRAVVDGVPMDPDGADFQAMDSEDETASAHAYEWVSHLGPGAHTIRIERRVGNAATSFYTDDWTFDTQLYA